MLVTRDICSYSSSCISVTYALLAYMSIPGNPGEFAAFPGSVRRTSHFAQKTMSSRSCLAWIALSLCLDPIGGYIMFLALKSLNKYNIPTAFPDVVFMYVCFSENKHSNCCCDGTAAIACRQNVLVIFTLAEDRWHYLNSKSPTLLCGGTKICIYCIIYHHLALFYCDLLFAALCLCMFSLTLFPSEVVLFLFMVATISTKTKLAKKKKRNLFHWKQKWSHLLPSRTLPAQAEVRTQDLWNGSILLFHMSNAAGLLKCSVFLLEKKIVDYLEKKMVG